MTYGIRKIIAGGLVVALGAGACASAEPAISNDGPTIGSAPSESAIAQIENPADDGPVTDAVAVFLAQQSSINARSVVEAIAADGDVRWVPWLVDLLRLGLSSLLSADIQTTLSMITGETSTGSRIPDLTFFGGWARTNELDGGEGYREWKSRLYGRIDDEFEPLLASIVDQQALAAVQWGGVPRGGIPELNDQERIAAVDADWMVPDEVVLGVEVNGQAVAYPLRILARHELANDTVGGVPVSIVYCTLCRSGLLFDRRVGDQVLSFQTSGLLLDSNKVMVDNETDTLWHHLRGLGIGGPLVDVQLTQLPLDTVRWSDWLAEHPDTEVPTFPSTIWFDDPERDPIAYDYTPGEAYRSYYEDPNLWFPILDTPPTFDLKAPVVGIANNGDALALELDPLIAGGSRQVDVGGDMFTIEPTSAGVRLFDADGTRLSVEQSFWFAWYANHPDTRTG